jgi:small conductance mechanosensitive channel
METVQQYTETLTALAMAYVPRLLLAIVTLLIGLWLIKKVVGGFRRTVRRRNLDPSLTPFLATIISIALYLMLFISIASMVGIATTSFIAVLGAAGLAIGLALQGSLANFAGGVLILTLKPFKVGEVIESQGEIASVTEIQIFHTVLRTFDNKTVILPNGPLYNDKIINYSTEPTRKVEWIFGIGYDDDIDRAREIISRSIFSDDRVLDADAPFIHVSELADSSVNFKVRAEVNGADYWDVFFDMTERVKKAFDQESISIPYPQRDVHLSQPTT